jgi:hypothetical protein
MGEAKQRELIRKTLEAVRASMWTFLGDAAERVQVKRADLLALLLEYGMLGGGFTEAESDYFISWMEAIEQALDQHLRQEAGAPSSQLKPAAAPVDLTAVGRLALRQVGDQWVAFYAVPESMEGALELGRIQLVLVEREERRRAFMNLMSDVVADLIEERVGVRPFMPGPQPAPPPNRGRVDERE